MKNTPPICRLLCLALLVALVFPACKRDAVPEGPLPQISVIPKPVDLTPSPEYFSFVTAQIAAPSELSFEADYLIAQVKARTGAVLYQSSSSVSQAAIRFVLEPKLENDEAYRLEVTPSRITISGKTPRGIFYGIQTLCQLLPDQPRGRKQPVRIPCINVKDAPRFAYRGMHLDVSRHFFGPEVIKRYLDMLARYKFNTFHWHLTDDQGWRVEIESYPKLNTISSWRDETLIGHHNDQPWRYDGKRHGGYYTKAEIRDIVGYAAARHITIIPEIEMPGHSQAILAAYPEFGCTGNKVEVRRVWSISDDVLCPKEETFAFLEAVLAEVIDLFPGKYIHIGGDECPKTQWEQSAFCQDLMRREGLADEHALQSWFVQRIERFINSKGRVMIGWDEILEGGLAPNAVVMSWRGNAGGIEAARLGHDVIMSPTSHVYLDYYQSTHPDEPLAIGGYLPLEKVYSFEPIPAELTPEQHKHILGAQANVWTEYINTPLKLDYMAWPRGIALAEVVWSPAAARNFVDFATRLETHVEQLRKEGIYAANHLYELGYSTHIEEGMLFLSFEKILPHVVVYYSTDGEKTWQPTAVPIRIDSSVTVVARSESQRGMKGKPLAVTINKHLAAGAQISVTEDPAPQYNHGGIQNLLNGITGSDVRYGDSEWRGFPGTDLDATIDLGEVKRVTEVSTRCFEGNGQWIHLPSSASISYSTDGVTYEGLVTMKKSEVSKSAKAHVYRAAIPAADVRYLKVRVNNLGTIPEGMEGAGHKAWLFVDEIVVR